MLPLYCFIRCDRCGITLLLQDDAIVSTLLVHCCTPESEDNMNRNNLGAGVEVMGEPGVLSLLHSSTHDAMVVPLHTCTTVAQAHVHIVLLRFCCCNEQKPQLPNVTQYFRFTHAGSSQIPNPELFFFVSWLCTSRRIVLDLWPWYWDLRVCSTPQSVQLGLLS